jgi:uncharacterized protein (TIGR02453 family)
MLEYPPFDGFPESALKFYAGLKKNNSKAWFEKHRDTFDNDIMAPARSLVFEMGERLRLISPDINADPRVNKSIFRINRDTRFSKNKKPYKTHLALWFWEGEGPRMESSGFYLHLESDSLMMGAGMYCFPRPLLTEYRNSVVHEKHGEALTKAIEAVGKKGYGIGGESYKRIPRGFDPDHPNAELLKHDGLWVGETVRVPKAVHSRKLLDYVFKRYQEMRPIHYWLRDLVARHRGGRPIIMTTKRRIRSRTS